MDGDKTAFDLWLRRELRRLHAEVLDEPVPDELAALIHA